jgi:hypothetical protein
MLVLSYASSLDLDALLASDDPFRAIHTAVRDEVGNGATRERLLKILEDARERFENVGREADSDVIADVMDCLAGWCGPAARI